ncbi:cytochrome c oxidase subunit I [Paracidobacterium acidisoli]|uniref:Cytochrome c oxidase subunit I n=1 Tax=Paracidobacterium acidisoli TaxID=2303751 RepID=A0A372IRJ1_9BACT|nr:cbb3-type cytochrome c oxidase subunit I [Paracidobacterium acidisoli]MBT9330476.1 cbb3-type cytochrome c oxidase subunit I [Paracidobacterium acidisoli]
MKQARTAASDTERGFLRRWIFTADHHAIAVQYFLLALAAVAVGTLLSLLMRVHRVWPDTPLPFFGLVKPEDYLALVTMHGTLMIFFVLTVVPQSAFPNLVLTRQIGASQMAFPRLNAAAFWITAASLLVLLSAFFVPGGAPISGWANYPPLSAVPAAGPGQATGMDLWLVSIGLFCIAAILAAVNFLVTILTERCAGMTWSRLPLTVWSWLVTSILTLLAFSVLIAAVVLLLCDRHFGTSFFVPMGDFVNGRVVGHGDGSPLLWLHLFWFFGHPEVYISILPGMGLASSLIANFTRRPVPGYRLMASALVLIGLLGLMVWGHHMFVSGMNPYAGAAFALTTMAIAVPSSAEVLTWLAMLFRGRMQRTTSMLFMLGFLSFFIAGGLSGPILAQPDLDGYLHNTFFVVAHFHLVMAMAGVFSIFAGIYYWFPLMTGRLMNETLGKAHFWISLIAAYGTFFPMHFAGLAGEPRHYERLTGPAHSFAALLPLERGITCAALLLAAAQLIFLWNLLQSARRGRPAGANPWKATTLEWAPARAARITHGPYEYGFRSSESDFISQWEAEAEWE